MWLTFASTSFTTGTRQAGSPQQNYPWFKPIDSNAGLFKSITAFCLTDAAVCDVIDPTSWGFSVMAMANQRPAAGVQASPTRRV